MFGNNWVKDVRRTVTVQNLEEFFQILDLLANVELHDDVEDMLIWTATAPGIFSSISSYKAFFEGSTKFEP